MYLHELNLIFLKNIHRNYSIESTMNFFRNYSKYPFTYISRKIWRSFSDSSINLARITSKISVQHIFKSSSNNFSRDASIGFLGFPPKLSYRISLRFQLRIFFQILLKRFLRCFLQVPDNVGGISNTNPIVFFVESSVEIPDDLLEGSLKKHPNSWNSSWVDFPD